MLKPSQIDPIVRAALKEDIGSRDITSSALIPKQKTIKADIIAKQSGVLCGVEIAERVFRIIDENLRFLPVGKDGDSLEPGREIAYLEGSAASILIGERTALNFLGALSGIATKTKAFVDCVQGTEAVILDTRKTTPNLRLFEKYAVLMGGGVNHRFGLYDQVLIKDNHLRILKEVGLVDIVARARQRVLKKTIIGLEVKNLKEFEEALKTQVNYILIDNMLPQDIREAVALRKKAKSSIAIEVSGGICLENVREFAEAGADRISVGALTHSAPSIDVSLDIVA